MTSRDRAFEIVAAYGANAARWPDDERAGVLALAAADPELAAARANAAQLDTLLDDWALAPAVKLAAPVPVRHWRRLGVGTALAASLAGALLLLPGAPVPIVEAPVVADDAQAFALLFTQTPDEEDLK